MTTTRTRRALRAGVSLCTICLLTAPLAAQTPAAQTSAAPDELPEIVVTAARAPQSITRSGSAVTVIRGEDVAATGAKSFADVLRGAPGLDIYESGGPGGLSGLSLRGASPGQTLILIDGQRAGDPSTTGGELDLGVLSVTDIDRVEVLRGPQSALYGSDAMGGVVNVITRKGAGKPKASLLVEAGSYGTLHSRASVSGGTDTLSYAFSIDGFRSDGFSRYGYRIPRITRTLPGPLEKDATEKGAATGRVTWRPVEGVEFEIGGAGFGGFVQFDNPSAFGTPPDDRFMKARNRVTNIYAKATVDSFAGALRQSVTAFGYRADHVNRLTQACFDAFFTSYDCNTFYRGQRYGLEYQAEARLGAFGTTIFGLRSERETAKAEEQYLPLPAAKIETIDAGQTTNSAFLLHQVALGSRLDLSVGGRVDHIVSGRTFVTGRATLAYHLVETGTKLRASVGTGAKAATLYQRFSIYGRPDLQPEKNVGFDAGIDQTLAGGRVKLSATAFHTRYRDLIDFDLVTSKYGNVARALMQGVELSGEAAIIPEVLRLRAAYTYLHAQDEQKKTFLYRRPFNKGLVAMVWNPLPQLELEARATFVGTRFDFDNQLFRRTAMPAWGKLDLRGEYRFNDSLSAFARVENVTNARYEEIRDYGTSGRAFYAGLKATW
jgi:vitamin B12 transporter